MYVFSVCVYICMHAHTLGDVHVCVWWSDFILRVILYHSPAYLNLLSTEVVSELNPDLTNAASLTS